MAKYLSFFVSDVFHLRASAWSILAQWLLVAILLGQLLAGNSGESSCGKHAPAIQGEAVPEASSGKAL